MADLTESPGHRSCPVQKEVSLSFSNKALIRQTENEIMRRTRTDEREEDIQRKRERERGEKGEQTVKTPEPVR